ncbi:MAG: coproporphyrinogen-III oxidase family protein, partial [Phycisphaerae bacterium]
KNARDVDAYVTALVKEVELYSKRAAFCGRDLDFVYFGGGTPSFLSSDQLRRLVDRITEHWAWEKAREVTFECEPGTLTKRKLETIRSIGVTRLSLGAEHTDDEVLALNGRAHKSPEVFRAYQWAREVGFDQINLDLLAGMVGDSESKWKRAVEQILALAPDSVTIYQMEVPHNTALAGAVKAAAAAGTSPVIAGWSTRRGWVDYAFGQFEAAGYEVSSAYTVVKPSDRGRFVYRDALWHGADMIGTGVASFSYLSGVHFQNADSWGDYLEALSGDALPLSRAFRTETDQRLIRELILQLKLGRLDAAYFRDKFAVQIADRFGDALASLVSEGLGRIDGDRIELTRAGLVRVDGLLPRFFEPRYRGVRYT